MVHSTPNPPQLSFDGLGADNACDRLFFALFPDTEAAARIAELAQTLRRQHGLHGRPQRQDRLHVTLHHLGDYVGLPQGVIADAELAAARVEAAPFDVVLDSASSFGGRSGKLSFVLRGEEGVESLAAFQTELDGHMKASGLARWTKGKFVPHVTLLYDHRAVAPQPVAPVSWTVREFVLVHSLIGKTEHRVLGRWPLRG